MDDLNRNLKLSSDNIMKKVHMKDWSQTQKTSEFIDEKYIPVIQEMNKYENKDMFKEHLMLNIW